MDYAKESLRLHREWKGKIEVVATVPADLPKSVRAVLQRGLEPDPAKRWPDMTSLLAALDRAFSPPSRRGMWVGALVAVAASWINASGNPSASA